MLYSLSEVVGRRLARMEAFGKRLDARDPRRQRRCRCGNRFQQRKRLPFPSRREDRKVTTVIERHEVADGAEERSPDMAWERPRCGFEIPPQRSVASEDHIDRRGRADL